jgi:Raf kinase inhibitor-like YbhB/YbcL family protein
MRITFPVAALLVLACGAPRPAAVVGSPARAAEPARLVLASPAFSDGGVIPNRHSGWTNVSPELSWDSVPPGVRSFAIVCEDPDAPGGTFVHWVIYNIPADRRGLAEGMAREPEVGGMTQGANDFGSVGYRGPEPPPGSVHRYFFRLYALDTAAVGGPGLTAAALRRAFAGHELGTGALMGVYRRWQSGIDRSW